MKPVLLFLIVLFTGCSCPPAPSPPVIAPAPEPAGGLSEKEARHLSGGAANLRKLDSLLRVKN
jgi:hypothetical protein